MTILLTPIPDVNFRVSVQEYASRTLSRRCPTRPTWVTDVVKNGLAMSLSSLIIQSGRHFSDKLNTDVFAGSATRRQQAAALAWTLISMVRPVESNNRLVVVDPKDSDVKRLCSEILGVGAALEFVLSEGLVDGRTIKKIGGRFDFQASGVNGSGKILIEAKGTFNGISLQRQRNSFFRKLPSGKARSYSRAIGVIFSTWTSPNDVDRGCDVEILDPEREPENFFEETVREVIRFYARRFDEVIGKTEAADALFSLANSPQLFKGDEPLFSQLEARHKRAFSRSALVLRTGSTLRGEESQEFWGGFWENRAVPIPLAANIVREQNYNFAYTGIDSAVIRHIRQRNFDELLAYRQSTDQLFMLKGADFHGHFLLDQYGILRGWMNKVPTDQMEFTVG